MPSMRSKISKFRKRSTMEYIESRRKAGALHFCLIDPDKQSPKEAGQLAKLAADSGSDAIMVGGSQAGQIMFLDKTVSEIKQAVKIPVILFPSSHSGISRHADAIFFMSLLNSRSPQYLIEEQMKGSILVKTFGIEALPMGYLIVESGSTTAAAWAGDVKLIPRERPEFALGYSLAAKYFGMRFIYLEAGSGAKQPVPDQMIGLVKHAVGKDTFVIAGGGIRDPETAKNKVAAGADIIVTGTIGERDKSKLAKIIKAVKGKH